MINWDWRTTTTTSNQQLSHILITWLISLANALSKLELLLWMDAIMYGPCLTLRLLLTFNTLKRPALWLQEPALSLNNWLPHSLVLSALASLLSQILLLVQLTAGFMMASTTWSLPRNALKAWRKWSGALSSNSNLTLNINWILTTLE